MADPGASTRKRQPFRRLSSDQRREELIEAAVGLFGQGPENEVSIDDIVALAGTSRSSFYRYFDSRDELYLTAMSRLSDELIRRLGAVDPGPPSALLAARVGIFFDFLDEFGDGYENMLGLGGPGTPAAILEIGRSARVKVCEVTYRALRIDDPPQVLRTAVQAWVAGVEWAGLDWFRTRGCPRAEVEQLMCIQFLMMLIGVGALDPVVANRVEWLTGVEPTDGSFAWFLHMAAARYSIRTAANLTRLLAAGDS